MNDRWISASEACGRLLKLGNVDPARAICSRAADGVIVAKAYVFLRDDERHYDYTIPTYFWWARGEAAIVQNWQSGDFETWINEEVYCRAYNVMFRETEIEEMLPPHLGSLAVGRAEEGNYASAARCRDELRAQIGCSRQEAETQIIRSCRLGMIAGRCTEIKWRVEDRFGRGEHEAKDAAVPDCFWEHCTTGSDPVLDWDSGYFAGRGEIHGTAYIVSMRGVEFDVGGIVALERMLAARAQEDDGASQSSTAPSPAETPTRAHRGGRPRSDAWGDWIVELVALVHEEGLPEGSGTEGQDTIIARIDSRLIERGVEGPSRSTVQPVVRAVLQRLRPAGN